MADDRLPWFPCEPAKLLGALSAMKPHVGYTYWIVCLRCYDVGGACPDSLDALARRTGYSKRIVTEALDVLFRSGKLVRDPGGILNPYASSIIDGMRLRRGRLSQSGRDGANRRWEKAKGNQSNDDGHPIDPPLAFDAEIHKEKEKKVSKEVPRSKRARPRTTLHDDWKLSEKDRAYAVRAGYEQPGVINRLGEAFANHHRARGNLMADWGAAWRTWVDNEIKFSQQRRTNSGTVQGSGRSRVDDITFNTIGVGDFFSTDRR